MFFPVLSASLAVSVSADDDGRAVAILTPLADPQRERVWTAPEPPLVHPSSLLKKA